MFSVYDQSGLRFAYPESWTLTEEDSAEATRQLTVASTGTAFWTLALYPGVRDLDELADQVVEALRAEYPDLEVQPLEQEVGEHHLTGRDIDFICFDLTNTARIRTLHYGASTMLLLAQAEDRELPEADQVFTAITGSLLGLFPVPENPEASAAEQPSSAEPPRPERRFGEG